MRSKDSPKSIAIETRAETFPIVNEFLVFGVFEPEGDALAFYHGPIAPGRRLRSAQ